MGKQVDSTGGGTYNCAERYVYGGNDVAFQFHAGGNLTHRYLSGPSESPVEIARPGRGTEIALSISGWN